MPPNGSGAGTDHSRLSGYIESRVVAAAEEHPFSLEAADLPEWRHEPNAGPLNQWYIGELFGLCSRTGVEVSRCSTVHGPLHLSKLLDSDGAHAELCSAFPYSGYLGVHQIRIREGNRWPFLSVETSVAEPIVPNSAGELFEIGQGRLDAAVQFSELENHTISGRLLGAMLCGLDSSLQAGSLPRNFRISGVSDTEAETRGGLFSFEWKVDGSSAMVETVVMAAPEGKLIRRGGVLHLEELPHRSAREIVSGVIETMLGGDIDEILKLPLSIPKSKAID